MSSVDHDAQRDRALIARVERMEYEEMVHKLRFAPIGDPMFLGTVGEAFGRRLRAFEDLLPHENKVAISKKVGWSNHMRQGGTDAIRRD